MARFRRDGQKQVSQRMRRDRRRLGRFVAFAEMQADLRPTSLVRRPPAPKPEGRERL
jgi:hypothetical protein